MYNVIIVEDVKLELKGTEEIFRNEIPEAQVIGTAMTEEAEFQEIYKLDVIEIPTNKPIARIDENDVVYKTEKAKLLAVIEKIASVGKPVMFHSGICFDGEFVAKDNFFDLLKGEKVTVSLESDHAIDKIQIYGYNISTTDIHIQ